MIHRVVVLFIIIPISIMCYSQRVAKLSATYTYYAPETMSVEEAKRVALNRTKIQAIADEFGTIVSQSTSTIISNKNGETDEQFYLYGGSDVKGEWIETIGEPKYNINYTDNTLVVICTITGKAREIVSSGIDFIAKPLRNGTDLRFETNSFKDGDDLYLYFQSPIDGFLAIYLLDEVTQTVYNILPYKSQNISAVPVEANRDYVFFSKDKPSREYKGIVDEYVLSCDNPREYNTIYILFSPYPIGKRIGFDSSIDDKPDNIHYNNFKQWLSKTLSKDNKIQFQKLQLIILKQ